jgi:periplasmic divalent cation tolerance protein
MGDEANEFRLLLTTFGAREEALRVARLLVDERLAACVNVVDGVRSVYRWKGKVSEDGEVLCVVKTTAARVDALRARLVALHPYELPEAVVLAIDGRASHAPYLGWIAGSVADGGDAG